MTSRGAIRDLGVDDLDAPLALYPHLNPGDTQPAPKVARHKVVLTTSRQPLAV